MTAEKTEELKGEKAYKSYLMPVLIGECFPFIGDGRRDTACAEGNQKAVVEQCVNTHMQSTLLSLGGVPTESQTN